MAEKNSDFQTFFFLFFQFFFSIFFSFFQFFLSIFLLFLFVFRFDTDIQLRLSDFLAHTRRHCSAMAHFPHKWTTGRNGGNGLTGWMQSVRHSCISFPHSKIMNNENEKSKSTLFSFVHDQSGRKKMAVFFQSHNQSVTSENRKVLFYATLVAPNGEKIIFFHCSTCWNVVYVCVIAFTQSAHFTHSAHLWGREVGHGAAVAPSMSEKVTWAQLYVYLFSLRIFRRLNPWVRTVWLWQTLPHPLMVGRSYRLKCWLS